MSCMRIAFCILLLATFSAAADKAEPKPSYTLQQKIELLTLERDMLAAQLRAQPADIAAQQASQALQARHAEILKELGVDPTKWTDNLMSFDFSPVAAPPKEAPKPAEKPAEHK
jgi:hypothetical protein